MKATTYEYIEYKPKGNVYKRSLTYSKEVDVMPADGNMYQLVSYDEYKITFDDIRNDWNICRLWYKETLWNQEEKEIIVKFYLSNLKQ